MKHLRSILASIVAIVMVFAMGVPAYAVENDTHTISLVDTDTHTYRVYQVLTGTLAKEGESELGNPAWGADAIDNPGDVNEFIDSIKDKDASTVADLVIKKVKTEGNAEGEKGRGTVSKDKPLSGLKTGYYIMVDETDVSGEGNKFDTKALHVVTVLNDINGMRIKWDTTKDDKKILTDTLGENNETNNNNSVNGKIDNVSIGDTVNYQITASIPKNANLYNYFYFIVNDTLDKGLTLDPASIAVEVDGNTLEAGVGKGYILKTGNEAKPYSFQVGLNDAKSFAGKDVIVTYSAVLNGDAEIGQTPNKNTSTVTFSNDPNHEYNGNNNNPGFPASVDDDAMGETPKTETETYTTGIEIQKVDEKGNVLKGATFKLSGTSIEKKLTVAEEFVEDANGVYYKLKNGTYTKDAPTQTGNYMVKADGDVEAGYVVDAEYEGDDKVELDGIIYRPYVSDMDTDVDVYILHTGNGHLYDNVNTKYRKELTKKLEEANDEGQEKSIEKAVDNNGLVRFDGLGASGENGYTITESQTPAGYNTLNPIKVFVTFNKSDGNNYWSFNGDGVNGFYDSDEGIYKITIKNNKGTALPSTGGIGTTVFYIVGGVMVAGAVVFLLTKRRMSGNE